MEPAAESEVTDTLPHISVVIPTFNRPQDITRCLESLTYVKYPRWNVLVVDQSDDESTQEIVQRFQPVIGHLQSKHVTFRGSSRAKNLGIELATGNIVALLDDDCTVESDWLTQVAGVFARHTSAAMVFGTVKAATHDSQRQFIPSFEAPKEESLDGRFAVLKYGVMGASMYLAPARLHGVGLFDVHLGPGSRFFTSEEWELCYRALSAGKEVVVTPAIVVQHYGAREYGNGNAAKLIREYCYSVGAVDMKLLRCGQFAALLLIGAHVWKCLSQISLVNLLQHRGPTGLAWPIMYARGLAGSLELSVDRSQCLYVGQTGVKKERKQHVSTR